MRTQASLLQLSSNAIVDAVLLGMNGSMYNYRLLTWTLKPQTLKTSNKSGMVGSLKDPEISKLSFRLTW